MGALCSLFLFLFVFHPLQCEAGAAAKRHDASRVRTGRGAAGTYPASRASTQAGGTKHTADRRYDSFSPRPPAKERGKKKSVIRLLVTSASLPSLIRAAAACVCVGVGGGGVIPVRMRAASDCERFTTAQSDQQHLVAPLEQMGTSCSAGGHHQQ